MRPQIRAYEDRDQRSVVALWERCGLVRPWNDPHKDIARKLTVQRDLFLVAEAGDEIVGTVMAGYDGHRGWINYLGIDPGHRHAGVGRALVSEAESRLRGLGCPKVNLQIRAENTEAIAFYERIGFTRDDVVSFGKRLARD